MPKHGMKSRVWCFMPKTFLNITSKFSFFKIFNIKHCDVRHNYFSYDLLRII